MKFLPSSLKERLSQFRQLVDSSVFGFEWFRGVLTVPLVVSFKWCHEHILPLFSPDRSMWGDDNQSDHLVGNKYCLNGCKLSFYDTFRCVRGIPAFLLDETDLEIGSEEKHSSLDIGSGSRQGKRQGNEKSRSKSHQGLGSTTTRSVRECAFSLDSSRLAVCYSNGEVIIWDTDHGTLVKKITTGENEISAVSFHGGSNSVLLICTANHKCWRCNTSGDDDPECTKFLDTKEVSGISGEVYLQKSDFFMNGNMLVLSFIANCEHGLELRIVLVDTSLDPNKSQHLKLSPMPIEETLVISKVALSPDGSGIFVGLIDEGMEDSFCVLWPNFKEEYSLYHKLRIGTVGSWSLDSKYVVTWTMIGTSNLEDDNRSSAFIWNVEEIGEQPRNPEYSLEPKYTTITNPFKDQVVWCHIVADMDQKHRLIMGIAGESVRFLYWDLESKIHTHTIETKVSARDMILCNREVWIEHYVSQMSVKGLAPMSVDKGGILFGAVLGWPSEIFVWDVRLGVEVLKISSRDLPDNQFEEGINLTVSPTCEKFAIIGTKRAMVFCPSVPNKYTNKKEELLEAQMVELENQNMSHKITKYKMKFSGDGDTLGVLCIELAKMQLWNLPQGTTCIIDVTRLHGGSIRDFSISYNGKYLTTYTDKYIQVWRCDPNNIQPIGLIEVDSEVMDMGIKDNALKIVLCLIDGSILVYCKQTTDEISNFDNENGTSISNPSIEDDSGQCFRTLRSDLEQPFLSDSVLPHETPLESVEIDSLNKEYPLSKRHVLCEGTENEEAKFHVSSDFRRVIRILDLKNVETWNLETKEKVEDKVMDVERIARSFESYSPVSSISQRVYEKLKSSKEALFDGTSITLTEKTTVVQSAKEHVVVAADTSSSRVTQNVNRESIVFKYKKENHDDSHSVFLINLNDAKSRRRLSGKNLDPSKGLAISEDGRHVACFVGKNASKVVVWNVYASESLLPDYHFLKLNDAIGNKQAIKKEIVPMIDCFGSQFFNFQHPSGMSILEEAIWRFNNDLLKTILQYASKKETKVSFLHLKKSNFNVSKTKIDEVIQTSIEGKTITPLSLKVILTYLLKQVTHETEIVTILGYSLISIFQDYPRFLHRVVRDLKRSSLYHEIDVPERLFDKGRKFITKTGKSLNVSEEEAIMFWNLQSTHDDENEQSKGPLMKIKAIALPFENSNKIGKDGLLHNLLIHRAHNSVFDSFVVNAIVDHKWKTYARGILIEELIYHVLVSLSFTIYCFFLCAEHTYKIKSEGASKEENSESAPKEENSVPTIISFCICFILAIQCLFREFHQCIVYITTHDLFGLYYWLKSGWNLIEMLSYINVVIIIPLAEFKLLNGGKRASILSALVAVGSLLFWSRVLFYARPFRRTGPLVVTVSAIVKEIFYFLILTLTIMFGFSLAFHVLYRHVGNSSTNRDESCESYNQTTTNDTDDQHDSMRKAFGTFPRSFFTVFGYTFGEFDLEILYNAPNPFTALLLFVLYVVLIAVILLNMLIALMSEKFTRMHKDKEKRYIEAKARAIDDIDTMLSSERKKKLSNEIKEYLHIIIPYHLYEQVTDKSWTSRNESKQKKERNNKTKAKSRNDYAQTSNLLSATSLMPQDIDRLVHSAGPSQEHVVSNAPSRNIFQALNESQAQEEMHWYDSDSTSTDLDEINDE
eukprot:g8760.t1